MNYEYLTYDHYRIAAENGVSRQTADQRFYESGWSIEETITKAVGEKHPLRKAYEENIEMAKKNNISFKIFCYRVYKGKSAEDAVKEPKKGATKAFLRKWYNQHIEIAKQNQVSFDLFYHRVMDERFSWDKERAIKTAPANRGRNKTIEVKEA